MKSIEEMKGRAAIRAAAYKEGVSFESYRREIQAAIDAAWESPDPKIRKRQRELFASKPSPELFVVTVAKLTFSEGL